MSEINLPFSVQIELVRGCTRMCDFCGIYGIWRQPEDKHFEFMTLDLCEKIAIELDYWFKGKGKRIEFAMHGEPLLHKQIFDAIALFRQNYPKSQLLISSNGDAIVKNKNAKEYVENLFSSGLNYLLLETYEDNRKEEYNRLFKDLNIEITNYYDGENVYAYKGCNFKKIVFMDDIGKLNRQKKSRTIFNHAGNVNFDLASKYGVKKILQPMHKTCTNVFRELVIHYDGTITACCVDWNRELIVGKFPEESLESIWNGEVFQLVRSLLYRKCREFYPCARCDYYGGFRQGLLKRPSEKYIFLLEELCIEKLNKYQQKMQQYRGKYANNSIIFKSMQKILRQLYI